VATIVDEEVLQDDEATAIDYPEAVDEVVSLTSQVATILISEDQSEQILNEKKDSFCEDPTCEEGHVAGNKEKEHVDERTSPEKVIAFAAMESREKQLENSWKSLRPSPKAPITCNNGEKSADIPTEDCTDKCPKPEVTSPAKAVAATKRDKFYRQEGKVPRGKWALGAKIGVGSFGEVHVGMNTHTGVLMAIKTFVMKEAVMKDVRTEIELLRSLNHMNIVRYYGAQMDRKHLHIFQEWVPGGSVASLLSKFGPFSMEVIQSYLSQTLAGLTYLHQNDVMHRDIKGSNILVNDTGIVKLADFGASKKLANLQENLMMSMTVRGTPYFMAPEVFEEKYSSKADIWAFGCVAYQMVTGLPPWKDKGYNNPISLFNYIKRTNGPPPMLHPQYESFSKRQQISWHLFEELVKLCFDHDPTRRPTSSTLETNPFFLTVHDAEDDQESRGLFSPGGDTLSIDDTSSPRSFSDLLNSPAESPPVFSESQTSQSKLPRSKSVVQWKTSFKTPPRPKRTPRKAASPGPGESSTKKTPRQHGKVDSSPSPDTREWPEWARAQLQKQVGSDLSSISENASTDGAANLSDMMDSLAFSKDSTDPTTPGQERKRNSTIGTNSSNLVGLNFLERSTATFEI
jgi:mitogen-activated protein kinase kinase kinase 3